MDKPKFPTVTAPSRSRPIMSSPAHKIPHSLKRDAEKAVLKRAEEFADAFESNKDGSLKEAAELLEAVNVYRTRADEE